MKTIKTKKMLIALDYNPTAQKVAEYGFSIARAMNSEIVLLHVISDPVYYSSGNYSAIMGFTGFLNIDPSQLNVIEELKKASLRFLEKSKHHLGDDAIETCVVEGDCGNTILMTAKDLHADIIVMGSHSQKWLENIVMGSVTEKVLRHTSIPLFIIPTKQDK
jgi:nucleotide-binding universal stress UspA family protein